MYIIRSWHEEFHSLVAIESFHGFKLHGVCVGNFNEAADLAPYLSIFS